MNNWIKFGVSAIVGYVLISILDEKSGWALNKQKRIDILEDGPPYIRGDEIPFHIPELIQNATIPRGGRRCNSITNPGCEQQRSSYNP